MRTADFDYELPESYIAQEPAEPRDSSRLMIVDRRSRSITHSTFSEISNYLRAGDLLIANESRVIRARLVARKVPTGGKVELLLLRKEDEETWEALVQGRRTPVGTMLSIGGSVEKDVTAQDTEIKGEVTAWTPTGGRLIHWQRPIDDLIEHIGKVPLPPYIHTPLADAERYQTVYARRPGSVAAPTAGLHFTPDLLLRLRQKGVQLAFVTLDIGLDTFRPVQSDRVEEHEIHTEWCSLSPQTAQLVNQAKLEQRRVIAVGTTSVRVLESAARRAESKGAESSMCPWQTVQAFADRTDLFIYPGFEFRVLDALITNFHLPRSSLLMLVSAFADRELILSAYQEAIERDYRFFSFGDAMLIL